MSTIGCLKAKMGTTEYYITKMAVGELIRSVGLADELEEWENMTADEKMQRKCDTKRIITEIVPYIINDPDHFFGCLIVDIFYGFDSIVFEPLSKIFDENLLNAYRTPLKDFGTLTLPGKERLIALDGQHRLLALKIAVIGKTAVPAGYKGNIEHLKPHSELLDDEVSVILVKHTDNRIIRKIFNNINKYAKQTNRSDDIITSDDDIFAVIARKLISPGETLQPIGKNEIVNWKNTSLSERSKHLTTLSSLYTIAETILKTDELNAKTKFTEEQFNSAYQEIKSFWSECLATINPLKKYIELTNADDSVAQLRATNLLLKPVTHMALAHVARLAKVKSISWHTVCEKLNKIDWSFENKLWFNIIVLANASKKVIVGKDSIRQAGNVISYLVMGDKMTKSEIEEVKKTLCNAQDNPNASLPDIIQ